MPDQSHSNWQYIPQYNGPIHFYDKSITTNHANMSNEPDIVDRLIAAQLPICFEAAQLITWIRQERDEARREVRYFWLRSEACLEGNYGGGGRDLYKRLRDEFPERWGTDPVEPKWGSNP